MTRHLIKNLNKSINLLPPHAVITLKLLQELGISIKLAHWYVRSGWLSKFANEAFLRHGDEPTWQGAVNALQQQLNLQIHVGGISALQLLNLAHYVPLGNPKISLYTEGKISLPAWITKLPFSQKFRLHKQKIFELENYKYGLILQNIDAVDVFLSCPERAVLEILSHVKTKSEYEHAFLVCENLYAMRPDYVQNMMESCVSIKAKRLLLNFAEEQQHPWLKKLNLQNVSIGAGKRVIAGGGKYNAKYMISVPKVDADAHPAMPEF